MAITTINESDLIKDSRTVINSNFTELDTLKAPLASPALTGTPTAPTPNPGDDSMKLATTEYVQEEIRTHANLPVGFEYFSPNPNVPQGSLPLFGGEYSRATYSALWAWVQEQSGYLKTEADWQDLATANNGNVPYYSNGDGSTTFRVPSLKCWVKGANGTVTEVGSYLEAGLPNITGYVTKNGDNGGLFENQSGALYLTDIKSMQPFINQGGYYNMSHEVRFDASRSSSIYGNSTTVQPESIVGMWLVKAYGTVVDTGQIDEQQYIDDRIAALPTSLATTFLPLAGGTMTGDITSNANDTLKIKHSGQEQGVHLWAGENDSFDGATLQLFAPQHSTYAGQFWIRASTKTSYDDTDVTHKSYELTGRPDGTLTWDKKEVERVNSGGTWYIRFESGVQILWGEVTSSTSGKVVTLPVAFKSNAYEVTTSAGANVATWVNSWTTTSFKLFRSTEGMVCYIAIGRWK